jgi:hypothetical protein
MALVAVTLAMVAGPPLEPPPPLGYRDRDQKLVGLVCDRVCRWRRHMRRVVAPHRGWLARLAWCESTNNPRAYSPAGPYFGLYQFDLRTWASVGGRGLPSNASRLEQSFRAVLLLLRRGTAPWPVCG